MADLLSQLRNYTTIVADTGDINQIKKYHPQDSTTNPSLILKASQKEEYHHLIEEACAHAKSKNLTKEQERTLLLDKLTVNFGVELLKIIPGRVSTEVDARLSFDTKASIDKAHDLIRLYEEAGISRDRILIKLASTWEGIKAAEQLESEGIHCNMTLLFCLEQAIACADAKATLISPFVGRILDWYKKVEGVDAYPPAEDPGVKSVTKIYHYFQKFGISTEIMGASFRNIDEILELAGCELLTISPDLLEELHSKEGPLTPKLTPESAHATDLEALTLTEASFRWHLNENAMATEKLSEGIRNFAKDSRKLEQYIDESFAFVKT